MDKAQILPCRSVQLTGFSQKNESVTVIREIWGKEVTLKEGLAPQITPEGDQLSQLSGSLGFQ